MNYTDLLLVFTSIIYEALPFVVLGVVLAGILEEFVPQQAIARIMPRSRLLGVGLGGVLGLAFPMCECGIIVVMRRLLRKGLPLSVCVAYMLSGPILNVVVLLSTYVAFNTPDRSATILGGPLQVVLVRAGMAYLIACTTGMVVEALTRRHGTENLLAPIVLRNLRSPEEENDRHGRTLWQRLGSITETALHDFVDIMAFLILGAALAAGGRALVGSANLESLLENVPAVSILLMMGIAVLFCLCSEADAFVAANFQPIWPPASKMSFLVLGPMLDIKLYLMYTRVFRPRLIFTIIGWVVVQVFVYSMLLHYLWPLLGLPYAPTSAGYTG